MAGSGDGCGQGRFGGAGLLVGGGNPAQDVECRTGWEWDRGLALAQCRAGRVAGRAQRHGAEPDGRGQRALGPAGGLSGIRGSVSLGTGNPNLRLKRFHPTYCPRHTRSRPLGQVDRTRPQDRVRTRRLTHVLTEPTPVTSMSLLPEPTANTSRAPSTAPGARRRRPRCVAGPVCHGQCHGGGDVVRDGHTQGVAVPGVVPFEGYGAPRSVYSVPLTRPGTSRPTAGRSAPTTRRHRLRSRRGVTRGCRRCRPSPSRARSARCCAG